jgi:hypothetical protein
MKILSVFVVMFIVPLWIFAIGGGGKYAVVCEKTKGGGHGNFISLVNSPECLQANSRGSLILDFDIACEIDIAGDYAVFIKVWDSVSYQFLPITNNNNLTFYSDTLNNVSIPYPQINDTIVFSFTTEFFPGPAGFYDFYISIKFLGANYMKNPVLSRGWFSQGLCESKSSANSNRYGSSLMQLNTVPPKITIDKENRALDISYGIKSLRFDEIKIIDIHGRNIYRINREEPLPEKGRLRIPVSRISPGIYTIVFLSQKEIAFVKKVPF